MISSHEACTLLLLHDFDDGMLPWLDELTSSGSPHICPVNVIVAPQRATPLTHVHQVARSYCIWDELVELLAAAASALGST